MEKPAIGRHCGRNHRHGVATRARAACALAVCLACTPASVPAGQTRAAFEVSVTVAAVARIETLAQARLLKVTTGDIQRGYIDAADATVLTVRSNSPHGFALDVHALAPLFKSMRLRYGGREVELSAEGGSIVQRDAVAGVKTLQLSYRFMLNDNLPPGDYAWPLLVTARPL